MHPYIPYVLIGLGLGLIWHFDKKERKSERDSKDDRDRPGRRGDRRASAARAKPDRDGRVKGDADVHKSKPDAPAREFGNNSGREPDSDHGHGKTTPVGDSNVWTEYKINN